MACRTIIPKVLAFKFLGVYLVTSIASRIDLVSRTEDFFVRFRHVMTRIKHGMLTRFMKMKPPIFDGFEIEDDLEFIVDCYDKLHKIDIMEQHSFKFVPFQL